MVAEYKASGTSFEASEPRLWSDLQISNNGIVPDLDLSPDGKHMMVFAELGTAESQKGSVLRYLPVELFRRAEATCAQPLIVHVKRHHSSVGRGN